MSVSDAHARAVGTGDPPPGSMGPAGTEQLIQVRASYILLAGVNLDAGPVDLTVGQAGVRIEALEKGQYLRIQMTQTVGPEILRELQQHARAPRRSEEFSPAVQATARQVSRGLHDVAIAVARSIRWRLDLRQHHRPLGGSTGAEWSTDGSTWQGLPRELAGRIWAMPHPRVDAQRKADVERLASTGPSEPVAYELLLEAEDNRIENQRSSLFLAVAAIEAGVKAFIAAVAPPAAWLAFEAPTPPLVRIVADYLPSLKTERGYSIGRPPKSVRRHLQAAIEARNQLAHTGEAEWSDEDLDELLSIGRSYLYALDYFSGQDWALEHLAPEDRTAWGIPDPAEIEGVT
jgi:hypothetical protein